MNPTTNQHLALADKHFRNGQFQLSEKLLLQIVDRDRTASKAFELLAYIYGNRGQLAECEEYLRKAAALPVCSAEALFYLGRVCLQRGHARDAIGALDRSVKLAGAYFEALHELGVAHTMLGDHKKALELFQAAERKNPRSDELHANLGNCLATLKQFDQALVHSDLALLLNPLMVRAWADRGLTLSELRRVPDALHSFDRALALAPHDVSTLMKRGSTLMRLKKPVAALDDYQRAAEVAPDTDYLHGYLLYTSMLICRWADWTPLVQHTLARVDQGWKAAAPFSLMSTPATSATLLTCTRTYAQDNSPSVDIHVHFASRRPGSRLRIGYFSSDFCNHPVSRLMVRLFECHDRSRFECFGFSLGPPTQDEMRERVAAALEHFYDVFDRSDTDVVALSRAAGIDIAIDLNGFTEGCRPNIFAYRAAPVQVNYLGFPGTMGCDYIDYIISDETLIRGDEYCHYVEKVVTLPGTYQATDNEKRVGDILTTRENWGLPAHGFVFACFNNNYKITPDVFDVWMRILLKVPKSVLWLIRGLEGNDASLALTQEAIARGVGPERIVWGERVALADHLERQTHADLFLDCFHYNAHTTCSDALWTGLPVLTRLGKTFPSRVAASLLYAIDLPELVTRSEEEYEERAIFLAKFPEHLAELGARLRRNRTEKPLFDTPLFAKRIEAAFEVMWERQRQGLAPDHIRIAETVVM